MKQPPPQLRKRASAPTGKPGQKSRSAAQSGLLKPLQLTGDAAAKLLESVLSMPLHAFYIFDHRRQQMLLGGPEIASLYGYTLEEIHALPEGWASLIHPDDRSAHDAMLRDFQSFEDDRVMAIKLRILRKTGEWEWVACNRRPHERDADGRMVSELGVVQIITRLVETTSALRDSEARYRTIFEQAADAIWIIDREGMICDANPQMCQRLGYTHEELVGMHVLETIPKERATRARQIIENARQSGGGTFKGIHQRKDGSQLPVEFSMSPLLDGRQIVIERDITERLLREDAARQRDMFYRSLFRNNSSGVARFDGHLRIIEVNPALARMLGMEPEVLVRRTVYDIIAPGGRRALDRMLNAMMSGQEYPSSVRLELHRADGNALHVHAAPTAFYHNTEQDRRNFHEGIVIFSDITEQRSAEAALKLSEERYARAMQGSSEGLWDWNIQTNEDYLSPVWKALLGYEPHELVNHHNTFVDLLHPDDLGRVDAAGRAHLEEHKPFDVELRLRTRDGEYRWFRSRGEAERDEEGRPTRMAGAISDITERKLAEEALRESESRYRLLADNTDDIVGLYTIKGVRLYISPSYFRKTGWCPDDYVAEDWRSRVHPDDVAVIQKANKAQATGKTTTIEHRTLCRDGSWLWLETRSKPLRGPDGKVHQLLVWSHDIHERKKVEEEYKRELEFNQALLNNTTALIVVLDGQGKIQHINQAVEKHFGYKLAEVRGLPAWAAGIMDAKESGRSKDRFLRLLSGQDNPSTEVRMRAKDGTWHTVDISSTATRKPDGSIDRIIVTGRDVTERNRLQNEVLKISEKEQARIGHDLHDGVGQTMTGLTSLLEALEADLEGQHKKDATRIRQLVQEAVQEVRRLSHGLSPAAVKNRGLAGALQLLAETVRKNFRTECTCDVDESLVLTDEEQQTHLYRISQEAINNALRHGKAQHVRLSLKREGENEAVLQIDDNGKGIKKTFSPQKAGIGMRVMEYRAHLINGDLQIKPLPRGVRVTCRFPLDPAG